MMKQQIVLPWYQVDRRQPLLEAEHSSCPSGHRFAEVAGGTTAECAAVVCCPCAVVNLMVLAVYRVPAGLYRKAQLKKRRSRLLKDGGLDLSSHHRSSCDGAEFTAAAADVFVMKTMEADKDVIGLENEMWEKFYGTGFWRSQSQRVD